MISLFLSLSLTLISVLGLAVNGYIFVVVLITKQFANASNILLLHLGSVNILLGVLSLSFSVPGIKGIEWPTSGAACTLYGFFFTLFHPLALWTVCGLNCDRYYVIAAPLHYSHIVSSKKVIIGLAIGWTISLVLCIPPLFTVAPYSYIPGLGACAPDFSVGDGTVWYAAAFTALSLLLPATVIVCCNLKILMIARYHRHRIASAIYEVTLSAQVTITHQRNPFFVPTVTAPSSGGPRFKGRSAICSVFELVGSFLVLYVPYYVALLLEAAINSLDGSRTAALVQENTLSHFYNLVTALLACTLPVNGFLYGLRSKALRKTFQNYWRKKQTKNEVNHEIQARTPSTCGSRRPSLTPLGFFAKPVLQRRLSETLFDASKSLKSPHRTKIKRIASELTWPSSSANSLNLSPKEEGKTLKQTTSCNTLQVPEGGPVEEEACFKERYRREQSGAGLLLQKLFRLEQEKLSRKAVQHVSEGTPERSPRILITRAFSEESDKDAISRDVTKTRSGSSASLLEKKWKRIRYGDEDTDGDGPKSCGAAKPLLDSGTTSNRSSESSEISDTSSGHVLISIDDNNTPSTFQVENCDDSNEDRALLAWIARKKFARPEDARRPFKQTLVGSREMAL
ncbi:G-protein coupled receptor 161-like isoform X2 [Cylas formicarius]|uniref:G-protein coupled receptor 161-like isoform X2 n=1 Tax=Cylas formicarius TaxID=197179 RepID=UPI002958A2C8|nr:G-protein coupled receptor 161-like isoform X2 [Cylas formicarius]